MFAGPNGSGKSTLKSYLPPALLGVYIDGCNPAHKPRLRFDNSGNTRDKKHTWLAEITDGRELQLKSDQIPAWFKCAVFDKIT